MHRMHLGLFFSILFMVIGFSDCFLWWPFNRGTVETNEKEKAKYDFNGFGNDLVTVPFEMKSPEDKFLQEAQKFGIQFSEQNICHHKIIIHLKKHCASLSEEEVGKLSVQLLNCQSSVEGRRTYKCTMEMSLAECTRDMDSDTWNAYHIVSNRARSVCYATRQQQFAAKTEITVNKLVWAAQTQLNSLNKLQETQENVNKLTSETYNVMSSSQKDLMAQQDRLRMTQSQIQAYVAGNLRELTREKALITAGQKELASMTEAIQQKLDSANRELEKQEQDRRSNHREILQDLAVLQKEAQMAWDKIDNSTKKVLLQHEEAMHRYQETLDNLQRINGTVNYLLALINETRSEVDRKFGWIATLVDGTGMQLSVMYTGFLHATYLTMGAIISAFLHLPNTIRMALVCLVPLNAVACANQTSCLDFPSLTIAILFLALGHWVICTASHKIHRIPHMKYLSITRRCFAFSFKKNASAPAISNNVSEGNRYVCEESVASDGSSDFEGTEASSVAEVRTEMVEKYLSLYDNTNNTVDHDVKSTSRTSTPLRSLRATRSPTPFGSVQTPSPRRGPNSSRASTSSRKSCSGRNKQGTRCKLGCAEGKDYCYIHQPTSLQGDDDM